jgi:XTP/dITP diphosphohydrolase
MTDSAGKLLIATRNAGKFEELVALLSGCPFDLVSLADAGIDTEVAETGSTYEENAAIKATAYTRESGMLTLADDSGLEVEALGGEPGILSSRYAGEGATDAQRIALLLRNLGNVPERDRVARFVCVIALARPGRPVELYSGGCRGRIVAASRGRDGFGYDPVFLLPETGKTMAELSPEEKNLISHRSDAARKALSALRDMAP